MSAGESYKGRIRERMCPCHGVATLYVETVGFTPSYYHCKTCGTRYELDDNTLRDVPDLTGHRFRVV